MSDTESNPPTSDTPAPAPDAPAAADPAAELEKLRAEREEMYNRYLRSVADLENYRRRVQREKDELRQFANRDLIEALLPVYENLGLAITSARQTTDPEQVANGIAFVVEQFRGVLAGRGVREINPVAGADFDPHQHESIAHQPDAELPEGKILQVVRAGFALNDRLIRPASVVLSSGSAPPVAASE